MELTASNDASQMNNYITFTFMKNYKWTAGLPDKGSTTPDPQSR